MVSIGVDIGATGTKIGLVNLKTGEVISHIKRPTATDKEDLVNDIVSMIKILLDGHSLKVKDIQGIGIGFPGAVKKTDGSIRFAANLNVKNYDLISKIKKHFNTKICTINDANAAAVAEYKYGKYKGDKNLAVITLGTGVGLGAIVDGKVFETPAGGECEIGHVVIDFNGKQCVCGRCGCLETYVSKNAIISNYHEEKGNYPNSTLNKLKNVEVKDIFEAYKDKDELASKLATDYIEKLCIGVTNMANLLRPSTIIFGGAIASQGKTITDPISQYLKQKMYGGASDIIVSTPTVLHSGIVGAASIVD